MLVCGHTSSTLSEFLCLFMPGSLVPGEDVVVPLAQTPLISHTCHSSGSFVIAALLLTCITKHM